MACKRPSNSFHRRPLTTSPNAVQALSRTFLQIELNFQAKTKLSNDLLANDDVWRPPSIHLKQLANVE